mmetsp:Transcript_20909/g.52841  ORF Transcript_20909/g.52841 Transcript_20909/m.52841 type:complete len:235 (+) Transcript_20909:145-849(+)|eukprot:CAMPEP_0178986196 /NCGR_PEP_ID=MMETSP0795-20121207/2576_1 /TAXON_ID=88552 /ORGANISM="Amoebophrya sp., Strain Ameob2" /LENGTH=234 /DNA_ID=CAMNT_0020677243 /DNA_START=45 /DNA_END=749 /DNA_ORIENTATION=+
MATTETSILLLPDAENIEETAKNALLKTKGVLGVAIHHFEGLANKKGVCGQRWYAAVTFNNLRVTQDKLRATIQEHADGNEKVFVASKGKINNFLTGGSSSSSASTKSTDAGDLCEKQSHAESYCMADEEDSSAEVPVRGYNDELDEWWGRDSDSEGEDETGGPAQATYLEEDEGKKRAHMNFFAPLVGVMGLDAAASMADTAANPLSIRPYGIKESEEAKAQSWWGSLFSSGK